MRSEDSSPHSLSRRKRNQSCSGIKNIPSSDCEWKRDSVVHDTISHNEPKLSKNEFLSFTLITFSWKRRHDHKSPNRILKELQRDKRLNFTNEQRKRLARKGGKLGLNGLRNVTTLVTPETILSWHRKLIALKYTAKRRISPLRKSQQEVRRMVVKIALENPTWGYSRIVGALQNLGVRRSKTTIANIL
jgi:hypothetical protein